MKNQNKKLSKAEKAAVISEFLMTKREHALLAIDRVERCRCAQLKSWCDRTVAHWQKIIAAIDWMLGTMPGRTRHQNQPDATGGLDHGMAETG